MVRKRERLQDVMGPELVQMQTSGPAVPGRMGSGRGVTWIKLASLWRAGSTSLRNPSLARDGHLLSLDYAKSSYNSDTMWQSGSKAVGQAPL